MLVDAMECFVGKAWRGGTDVRGLAVVEIEIMRRSPKTGDPNLDHG
jgi:hypothetical protein